MLPLIEFRVLDKNSVHFGVDIQTLMNNAGMAISDFILDTWPNSKKVLFLCGSGNNGGDGYVAARILQSRGIGCTIVPLATPKSDLCISNSNLWEGHLSNLDNLEFEINSSDVIVDAMLGSGIVGTPREPYISTINLLNNHKDILSVDIPSGFSTDCSVIPSHTLTFHDLKIGMSESNCGHISIKNIGFPDEASKYTGPGEIELWPEMPLESHKGQGGTVLIVGGGPYYGAPSMAGMGAYRMGADLVLIAAPSSVADVIAEQAPEFVVKKLPGETISLDHLDTILRFGDKADSLLVGPGLGKDPKVQNTIKELLRRWKKPKVIDADALLELTSDLTNNSLLTPHAGELKRIGGDIDNLQLLSIKLDCAVLAKGKEDIISDSEHIKINKTGHSRMRVGGTGDVLAGAASACLARGLSPYQAGRLSAYIVGRAGELASTELGNGYLATELALKIPAAITEARLT